MPSLDLSPLFRSTIGFDHLDRLIDIAQREAARDSSYPPYNIVRLDPAHYRITMAVAGFGPEDLEIVAHEDTLLIKGQISKPEKDLDYLHRGIAQRGFERRFQLAEHVRVLGADLDNGLLNIQLARQIPEAAKPRRIAIGAG